MHPSPPGGTPLAEFDLNCELVRGLLSDQHPDLADLPLSRIDEGWDNALFRLGDRWAVRLPRRAAAANLICHEQIWLPELAVKLPLAIPVPWRVGTPARGYPWHWSVVPWLPGAPADQNEAATSQGQIWGKFLRSLHVPGPADAPLNPLRGVALRGRAGAMQERLQRLSSSTSLVTAEISHIWEAGLSASIDVCPTWLHGDLHPRNVLVQAGVISGVVDWGDITSGDCATDLASLWMLFADPEARKNALESYGVISEPTIQRAKAWAVLFGVILLETGLNDNPRNAVLGEKILRQIIER